MRGMHRSTLLLLFLDTLAVLFQPKPLQDTAHEHGVNGCRLGGDARRAKALPSSSTPWQCLPTHDPAGHSACAWLQMVSFMQGS